MALRRLRCSRAIVSYRKANAPAFKLDLLQLLGEHTETQNKQTHALLQQHDEQNKVLLAQHVSAQTNASNSLLEKFAEATTKQFAIIDT